MCGLGLGGLGVGIRGGASERRINGIGSVTSGTSRTASRTAGGGTGDIPSSVDALLPTPSGASLHDRDCALSLEQIRRAQLDLALPRQRTGLRVFEQDRSAELLDRRRESGKRRVRDLRHLHFRRAFPRRRLRHGVRLLARRIRRRGRARCDDRRGHRRRRWIDVGQASDFQDRINVACFWIPGAAAAGSAALGTSAEALVESAAAPARPGAFGDEQWSGARAHR